MSDGDVVALVETVEAKSPPIPSGNPECKCATTDLEDDEGISLIFNEMALTIFADCPDHGEFVNGIMRDALKSLSVKATGPMVVLE